MAETTMGTQKYELTNRKTEILVDSYESHPCLGDTALRKIQSWSQFYKIRTYYRRGCERNDSFVFQWIENKDFFYF